MKMKRPISHREYRRQRKLWIKLDGVSVCVDDHRRDSLGLKMVNNYIRLSNK